MPNLNLLVPGTGGTTLMDQYGADIGYPVRMRLGVASDGLLGTGAEAYKELLSMEHDPHQIAPVKTSLREGTSLRPGHVLKVAYNQIPDRFNHFLYDWRADLRSSAIRLLEFLEERKPRDGRWNLVGHSQGGLIIVVASRLLDDPEDFAEMVRSVVLVGAPLAGTVNSAEALITGEVAGKPAAPRFQEILRTWPALYQMLPQWPAMVDEGGNPLPDDLQLLAPSGWKGVPGIRADFLERAEEVIPLLQDPLAHMKGDIRVTLMKARNRDTTIHLLHRDGGPTAEAQLREKGDTLVPFRTTIRWLGERVSRFVVACEGPVREHSFLLADPGVCSDVRRLVR